MKRLALITALTSVALISSAYADEPSSPPKPKLIVAIAVDQFSSDLFNEYRTRFSKGFKRLEQGVVFPAGYQGHAATETCPGHSTILTGSRPSRTGIIANDWMNPASTRLGKDGKPNFDVYCAEDTSAPASGSMVVSSGHLRVPTLGDRLKVGDPASRTVAVSGKDRAAVMMGGHKADVTIWWDGKAFVTYKGREATLPAEIAAINNLAKIAIDKPVSNALPPICQSHGYPIAVTATASVGLPALRKAGDAARWRASPQFDAFTLDAGLAAMKALRLGKGSGTDVLAISFSATDYVGHGFGTAGGEQCANLMGLDATIGRLLTALDKNGTPYAVVLTADHGGHDLPERNRSNGLPAAERADATLQASVVGSEVAKQLGLAQNALIGRANFGDIYLSPTVPADKRAVALAAAVEKYRAHRQVAAVFTKAEIAATASPKGSLEEWSLIERARASFDPERSGDLLVMLKPFVTPIPDGSFGYVATHGSPWGYDRRVPILFWWKGIAPFEQPNGVETVDILPTLASLIDLPVPSGEIDGRCLDLQPGNPSNCK